MKIVFVTQQDFQQLWLKLAPQERLTVEGLQVRHLALQHRGMLVLVAEETQVVAVGRDETAEFTLRHFYNAVAQAGAL